MAIEFSEFGSRIFTGRDKGEFKFNFLNEDNFEQIKAEVEQEKVGVE
jgi:hypothetical protein